MSSNTTRTIPEALKTWLNTCRVHVTCFQVRGEAPAVPHRWIKLQWDTQILCTSTAEKAKDNMRQHDLWNEVSVSPARMPGNPLRCAELLTKSARRKWWKLQAWRLGNTCDSVKHSLHISAYVCIYIFSMSVYDTMYVWFSMFFLVPPYDVWMQLDACVLIIPLLYQPRQKMMQQMGKSSLSIKNGEEPRAFLSRVYPCSVLYSEVGHLALKPLCVVNSASGKDLSAKPHKALQREE